MNNNVKTRQYKHPEDAEPLNIQEVNELKKCVDFVVGESCGNHLIPGVVIKEGMKYKCWKKVKGDTI